MNRHHIVSMSRLEILAALLVLVLPILSFAAVRYVPSDYRTIQAAINASSDGDEVIVSPKTYYENINLNGKNIVLRSTDPTNPDVVASTIIDGGADGSVVTFMGSELPGCALSGFTITHGYTDKGGGIRGNGTLATIQHNTITVNIISSDGSGGGIYGCNGRIQGNTISGNWTRYGGGLDSCNGTIMNNTISYNSAVYGGGLSNCGGTIGNNTISGNLAYDNGGGLYSCNGIIQNNEISQNATANETQGAGGGLHSCNGVIQSNIISGNSSQEGGGLCDCNGIIQSNTISGNTATGTWAPGGGLYECNAIIQSNVISGNTASSEGGGICYSDGVLVNNTIYGNHANYGGGIRGFWGLIVNCIIWNNTANTASQLSQGDFPIYSCIHNWDEGGCGNISEDPKFVDPANGDFHLQPESPCIDAGTYAYFRGEYIVDIDKQCRLTGSSIDIGCDEYGGSPDSDGDLLADTNEFILGSSSSCPDTDGDGLIDGAEILRGTSPAVPDLPTRISIPHEYPTIQQGIFLAFPGERVSVSPGSYEENIHFLGKNITLFSNAPTSTVISGGEKGSVVTFAGSEPPNCVLSGFTVTSGNYALNGGGIRGNGTLATIQDNIISGNRAWYYGGGLHECDGIIQNNIITGNWCQFGGGGLFGCDGSIRNNIIAGQTRGGGLNECNGTIQNNIISYNRGRNGGGLSECNGFVQNNTIYGNSASEWGGGLYECDALITNCILWDNTADISGAQLYECAIPLYSCIQYWTEGGPGNISAEPRFVNPDTNDFHLQSDSPCIDAGNYAYLYGDYIADIDQGCRIAGSSVDMGCDEYGSTPDSDGDLLSDIDEIALNSSMSRSDTDGDGLIDGVEILRGTNPIIADSLPGIVIPSKYTSIQEGIFLAFRGEKVSVLPGNYDENIHFLGKNIILSGTSPPTTVINGEARASVVTFGGSEQPFCILSGFTLTNGRAKYGGGIKGNGTRATIQNNIISGNIAAGIRAHGAGLHRCDGIVQNNIVADNSAADADSSGGGLSDCNGTIQNNTIRGNSAVFFGGGLAFCDGIIRNNTIFRNSAYGSRRAGGGLAWCTGTIRNCIIWENIPLDLQLAYCSAPSYSCILNWTKDESDNISDHPEFADPSNGDFHLLPSSPCIDAGGFVDGLTEDFEGDHRPWNGSPEHRGDGSDYDIGADEFVVLALVNDFSFDLRNEGWTTVTIPAYFTPPTCSYSSGQIILTAQDNTNTYGFWTSEPDAVRVFKNSLYRTIWTVATDVADPLAVPHMQLRVNSQNLQQADILVVSSTGDGSYAPRQLTEPYKKMYFMYFAPPESALGKPEDQDDLILSFDILNFDPHDAPEGSLLLDRVVVEAIPLSTLPEPVLVKTWSFDVDAEDWKFGSAPILFAEPMNSVGDGALWLIAQDNTNTFGYWSGPSEKVHVEPGKLYRLRFTLSTDVTMQDQVPQLRLRAASEDFQACMMKVISSVVGAEMSPTPEGRTYDLYFYPPQSLVGTEADSIIAAFDILNFDPTDAATGALMLNSVIVESLDVP